jgi:hypothetical protein
MVLITQDGSGCPQGATEADDGRVSLPLPVSGFRVVVVNQSNGRVAVEVYDNDGQFVDVVSASQLGGAQIRGAVQGAGWTLAFGQSPGSATGPLVRFRNHPVLGGRGTNVDPALVGRFWIAETPGRYNHVELTDRTGDRLGHARTVRARTP